VLCSVYTTIAGEYNGPGLSNADEYLKNIGYSQKNPKMFIVYSITDYSLSAFPLSWYKISIPGTISAIVL